MKITIDFTDGSVITDAICVGIVGSFITLAYYGITGENYISTFTNIYWIVFLIILLFNAGIRGISRCSVGIICIIGSIIGQIHGNIISNEFGIFSFFKAMTFALPFFLFFCIDWDLICSIKISKVFAVLFALTAISVGYALITQGAMGLSILKGGALDPWFYRSFFRTRNVYATVNCFGIFACSYFWERNKKTIWIVFSVIFSIQIIITSSRNGLLLLLAYLFMLFYMRTTGITKIILSLVFGFAILIVIYFFVNDTMYDLIKNTGLYHGKASGEDSTIIRFTMWSDTISTIGSRVAWIFGLGNDYADQYLLNKYMLGSTHNIWFDLLFRGGILRVVLYIYSLIVSFGTITNIEDRNLGLFWKAMFYAIVSHSFFDSFTMLFSATYYSYLVTMLVVFIPRHLEDNFAE